MPQPKSPAVRRYTKRLSALMTAYVALIFAMGWLFRHAPPAAPWNAVLAILPALPVLGVVWAVMRLLVEETDEFWRMMFVRQALIATGFCLTVMTIRDFLQNYEVIAPGNAGFGTAFYWFMGLGVGAVWNGITLHLADKS